MGRYRNEKSKVVVNVDDVTAASLDSDWTPLDGDTDEKPQKTSRKRSTK